jgi:sigma-B regulation protein RsbU (phosphoserine phosphatase)
MVAFAVEALFSNVSGSLGIPHWHVLDHAGFGVLLASFGYVAVTLVFDNERRLLAVEHELAVARRIQTAILPDGPPDVRHLRISATYRPMTAVGGDFYDFIRVGDTRVGILVADVAGHGVPAALIASMINVALQSVASSADDPGAVLCGLNRVLFRQSRTHLVSAAYLWLDTEHWTARYAAAGHPPLLRWGDGTLRRLESNGCLIGMMEDGHYPVLTTTIERGDRFLLYTDGVTEVENARGEFFDEGRLEQVLRDCRSHAPAAVSNELLSEIDRWRPARMPQQDDITFVVVDVA